MKFKHLLIIITTVIFTNNIHAQEITMFPGFWSTKYYQDDSQISKQQVESLMLKDSEANQLWQKSKQHMTIGWIAFGAEVGFLFWQLNKASNNESQTVPLIGVLGSAGVATGFSLSANNLKKKSILKYNSNADTGSLNFGPTYNGLGLVLSF
ncbi:MAG: hypothetical protein R3E32_28280 [Chitinophagales bacterium]